MPGILSFSPKYFVATYPVFFTPSLNDCAQSSSSVLPMSHSSHKPSCSEAAEARQNFKEIAHPSAADNANVRLSRIELSSGKSKVCHRKCARISQISCEFHPDAVTARTISRLSQGVARLSADDLASDERHNLKKSSGLPGNVAQSLHHHVRKTATLESAPSSHRTSSYWRRCLREPACKTWNSTEKSKKAAVTLGTRAISSTKHAESPSHSMLSLKITPKSFNKTRRVDRNEGSPLPITSTEVAPGTKRNFSHVILALREDWSSNRFLNSSTRTPPLAIRSRVLSTQTGRAMPIRQTYSICSPLPPGELIDSSLSLAEPVKQPSGYGLNEQDADVYSSDSSMLSMTPSRSCSTASSVAVASTSSDSDTRCNRSKAATAEGSSGRRRARYRGSHSRSTDCWRRWRSSKTFDGRISHPRAHRLPLASSNGDDSSDGPMCQRKRARVTFPHSSSKITDNVAEYWDEDFVAGAFSEGRRSQMRRQQPHCDCPAVHRGASYSPVRDRAGRRIKPTRFRVSNMEMRPLDTKTYDIPPNFA
uniref:Uncharacterized protein n=2 Tax=Schistocephalus solidus TaxID=70667 RepID=A0A0X3PUL1_SCHSO